MPFPRREITPGWHEPPLCRHEPPIFGRWSLRHAVRDSAKQ